MVISTTATTTTTTTTTTTATITSTVQAQAKTWPNYVYNILQLPQPLQNLWLSLEYPGEDDVFLSSFQVFQWSARLRLLIKTYQNYLYHSLSFSSMEWHGMAQMRLVAMSWSVSSICSDVPKSSSPILLEIVLIASWKVWSTGGICMINKSIHFKSIHINCSHPWVTCVKHCESKCYCYSSTCMDFVPDTTIGRVYFIKIETETHLHPKLSSVSSLESLGHKAQRRKSSQWQNQTQTDPRQIGDKSYMSC